MRTLARRRRNHCLGHDYVDRAGGKETTKAILWCDLLVLLAIALFSYWLAGRQIVETLYMLGIFSVFVVFACYPWITPVGPLLFRRSRLVG